jgi:mRNA-degrading endonuclease YafQ of YafQ-DinJ toxin-antitoxin module
MILTTDASFKRSFKRLVKKNPQLQDKILSEVLYIESKAQPKNTCNRDIHFASYLLSLP